MNLKDIKGNVHFIAIGGAGMSAIASAFNSLGVKVQGSDRADNKNMKRLKAENINVFVGHDAKNINNDTCCVVVSSIIKDDNVELIEARKRGLKVYHRAEALNAVMQNYKSIAISGTHGKTTTTALVFNLLKKAGLDAGIINGGVLKDLKTNFVLPKTKKGFLVVEADESDGSFKYLHPDIALVTNIEPEHMENYGTEEKLIEGFLGFLNNVKPEGAVILCGDDTVVFSLGSLLDKDLFSYSLHDDACADVYLRDVPVIMKDCSVFDASVRGGTIEDIKLKALGIHNIQNSLGALTVASLLVDSSKLPDATDAFAEFSGVEKRFDILGKILEAEIVDDYAHHPTEIKATVEAAKQKYSGDLTVVLEPHKYTRLHDNFTSFVESVKLAQHVFVLPVYAAFQDPILGFDSLSLVEAMQKSGIDAKFIKDVSELNSIVPDLKANDGVLFMGAGNSSEYAAKFLNTNTN